MTKTYGILAAGMLLCLLRDLLPKKFGKFVPSPMAMGIPFYIGAASVSIKHLRSYSANDLHLADHRHWIFCHFSVCLACGCSISASTQVINVYQVLLWLADLSCSIQLVALVSSC